MDAPACRWVGGCVTGARKLGFPGLHVRALLPRLSPDPDKSVSSLCSYGLGLHEEGQGLQEDGLGLHEEGLGPSLPDLRTPDENTQVGQRAPGLAAAAPLPRPLHHAACTTPPCRPEARPSCSPHRAVEAPHLSTPQHACLLGATLGRKPCLVTWLMISAHAEPHPCSYSLFVHHAPLLSQLRA